MGHSLVAMTLQDKGIGVCHPLSYGMEVEEACIS